MDFNVMRHKLNPESELKSKEIKIAMDFDYEEMKEGKIEFGEITELETRECTNPDISSMDSVKAKKEFSQPSGVLSFDGGNLLGNIIGFDSFLSKSKEGDLKNSSEKNRQEGGTEEQLLPVKESKIRKKSFPGKNLKKKRKRNSKKIGKSNLRKRKRKKRTSESKTRTAKKVKRRKTGTTGLKKQGTDAYRAKFFDMIKEAGSKEKKKESKYDDNELKLKFGSLSSAKRAPSKPKDFIKDFEICEKIGKGASSVVRKIKRKSDDFCFAMKSFKTGNSWPTPANEGHILDQLNHPNIVEFVRFYKSRSGTHLILEYFDAVTLGDFIQKKGHLSEKETKVISKQLFNTIRYCHAKRIAHRDLKPENVLVNKNLEIKLIDFAFSVKLSSRKSQLKADCGTPNYMAPEVVSRKVCSPQKADIWALGVMMYKMRTGKLPFSAKSKRNLVKLIKGCKFNEHLLDNFSPLFKDLLLSILQKDASKRPRAKEVLNHPFFNKSSN